MQKRSVAGVLIAALIAVTLLPMRPALATYEHGDVALQPISGSDCDSTTFEFRGHTIAEGFAVSISADLPCESYSQTKLGYAVAGLGESWEEKEWFFGQLIRWDEYNPYVKEMWVKVEGDSYYTVVEDAIFDNTGTGSSSRDFLSAVLTFIDLIFNALDIYQWVSQVYAQPPVAEWEPGLHSTKAISRQGGWVNPPPTYVPYLDPSKPRLQTGGANAISYFSQDGPRVLTVTAKAEIYVQTHDLLHGGTIKDHVGTYSVSFQVSVPVGVYNLQVGTYNTIGAGISYVDVIVDGETYLSPVSVEVGYGSHTVAVDSIFYRGDYKYTFQYWEGGSTSNPRTVHVSSNLLLKAYYQSTYIGNGNGNGGGCPFVSTWNGTHYALDNNLLPATEAHNGTDVVDYYKLQQPLVLDDDEMYRLLLNEFENEHDFFDHVRLIAVDHSSDVNVGVSPYGEILTYNEPVPPVSAIDDNQKNVKHILGAIDGEYYEGYNGSHITVNFGDELDTSNGAKLVIRADLPPEAGKWSIQIQVQDEDNNWNAVATIIPRVYWADEIIDMSRHLPDAKGNLKVRLYFTTHHKIDFVGLDTSPQATIDIHEEPLVSAVHSVDGDVTARLAQRDETYTEIVPGEQVTLRFVPTQCNENKRDFILIVKGYYFTIEP